MRKMMKMHKKLLLTALGLSLSVASFADKQPSLVQQMWRFAYPSYTIPKHIPLNAKRAITPNDYLTQLQQVSPKNRLFHALIKFNLM